MNRLLETLQCSGIAAHRTFLSFEDGDQEPTTKRANRQEKVQKAEAANGTNGLLTDGAVHRGHFDNAPLV